MGLISQIFYPILSLWFPDVETNQAPRVLFLLSAEYSAAMYGACPGTLVLGECTGLSRMHILGYGYATRIGVANSRIWLLCLVVQGQDTSG